MIIIFSALIIVSVNQSHITSLCQEPLPPNPSSETSNRPERTFILCAIVHELVITEDSRVYIFYKMNGKKYV